MGTVGRCTVLLLLSAHALLSTRALADVVVETIGKVEDGKVTEQKLVEEKTVVEVASSVDQSSKGSSNADTQSSVSDNTVFEPVVAEKKPENPAKPVSPDSSLPPAAPKPPKIAQPGGIDGPVPQVVDDVQQQGPPPPHHQGQFNQRPPRPPPSGAGGWFQNAWGKAKGFFKSAGQNLKGYYDRMVGNGSRREESGDSTAKRGLNGPQNGDRQNKFGQFGHKAREFFGNAGRKLKQAYGNVVNRFRGNEHDDGGEHAWSAGEGINDGPPPQGPRGNDNYGGPSPRDQRQRQ